MRKLAYTLFYLPLIFLNSSLSVAQSNAKAKTGEIPKGWHLMDRENDGQFGISLEKAYSLIQSKKLKGKTIVVAVIDSGVDTLHEDLKNILWRNPLEIAGNGVDDDKNGYIDDIYGWNFLGNKDGKNLVQDSYEGARVFFKYKDKYKDKKIDTSTLSADEKYEYNMWRKSQESVMGVEDEETIDLLQLKQAVKIAKKQDSVLRNGLAKEEYTGNDLEKFEPSNMNERVAKNYLLSLMKANNMLDVSNKDFVDGFQNFAESEERKAEQKEKPPVPYRKNIVGDNEDDINDKNYGNNNVMVSNEACEHGTHVAGIIAATRKNGKGGDGVADNVRIMSIRAVPDGDEHDKDIALAIRYAVDNGAKVINMSFGKSFSPQKKWVDEASAYAASKGVLIVHAAGNDHKNVDSTDNFPNPIMLEKSTRLSNWITVGASSGADNTEKQTAYFSNYGKEEVDVFAPGTSIYSTFPGGNVYRSLDGTSMASPVVAGTAALLLSYFPYLTPEQVKKCIEQSAQKPNYKVRKPGTDELVDLSSISKTGGIINAYEAAKIAAAMEPAPKTPPASGLKKAKKTKSTLKNKKG